MARNRKKSEADGSPIVVIGLGRFGQSLSLELMDLGLEVLGIDSDPRVVQAMAGDLTHVVEADSTDPEAMRQLSVHEFDRAAIGIGTNLECSILTASVLVDLGVRHIWAKAVSEAHARILEQVGVHNVVRPEHDMGQRVAHLVRGSLLEYIEFEDGYAIVKTRAPSYLHGKTLAESHPRTTYGITVVGVKRQGEDFTHAVPETVVEPDDLIIVSGERHRVEKFSNMG